LAVVGSRHVDADLIEFTESVGRLAAQAGRGIVSGGARGVDQAAMRGALSAGGTVCGALADSLEKSCMNREYRNRLLEGQLVLVSPYDPSAGFNVGHAMQRNKLIYALADAALVVSADLNKGGTWAGAVEQLDKLRMVPLFVRSFGKSSPGLDALRRKGASPWPDAAEQHVIARVFDVVANSGGVVSSGSQSLFSEDPIGNSQEQPGVAPESKGTNAESLVESSEVVKTGVSLTESVSDVIDSPSSDESRNEGDVIHETGAGQEAPTTPAEAVFRVVTDQLCELLSEPMKEAEVAAALDVSTAQAKQWLHRLVELGLVEKQKKPVGYVTKPKQLFG